jgi:hypothetical protein
MSLTKKMSSVGSIIMAIRNNNTKLVEELIDTNYLSEKEKEEIFENAIYHSYNSFQTLQLLILKEFVEMDDDYVLFATQTGTVGVETIQLLLDNGLDPHNLEALTEAAFSDSKEIVSLLLKHGDFDMSDIKNLLSEVQDETDGDYTDMISLIKKFMRFPNLRQQIKDSSLKQEFNWQLVCSKLNKEGKNDLIDFALGLEINDSVTLKKTSKRELCKLISEEMFDIVTSCEDSNLYGDNLNLLPKWRIFTIKGKCYDIVDLKNILRSGETRNPFTREQLPVDRINKRINILEKMSIKGSIDSDNLFTRVSENPIFNMDEHLKQQVVKLFGMFPYMLDTNLIIKATDSEINFMTDKLFKNSSNDILQATRNEIEKIEKLNGLRKKIAFLEVLNNGMFEEKLILLYDGFLYFSKKKNGEDLSDDRFLFMTN